MPWKNPDNWMTTIPFLLSAGQQQPMWNVPRLLEAIVIAGVSAMGAMGFAWIVLIPTMQADLDHLKTDLRDMKNTIDKIQASSDRNLVRMQESTDSNMNRLAIELMSEIRAIRHDFYRPVIGPQNGSN